MGRTVNRNVLVIGGGIAGIQSALLLAEKNHRVFVMDSAPSIGGFFPLLERTFPTNSCGICFMSPKPPAYCPIYENEFHDNITVFTNSDVKKVEGRASGFTVSFTERPRYVKSSKCTLCRRCEDVCPVTVGRSLGGGLEVRKAIYLPFLQAIPHSYLIDMNACTRCGFCLEVCPTSAINFDEGEKEGVIDAGAIVLGFGFEPNPGNIRGEYGFGRYRNVLSNIQYERMLDYSGPTRGLPVRQSDGKKIKKLAFIQCVGSRDVSCGRGYCSSICCQIAIKQAMISKSRDRELDITIFYMDIRAMGKEYEKYFERSKDEYGIRYIRSAVSSIRELKQSNNLVITYGSDYGNLYEEDFGFVVLSLGFSPPADIKKTAGILGIRLNEYGFCYTDEFNPCETSVPGIFVAGSFREPRDIPESVVAACSAAADVSVLLGAGEPGPEPDQEGEISEIEKQVSLEEEERRVGIFVCDKHNLIKQKLDLIDLIGELSLDKEIVRVKRVDFSVMEDGLREVRELIEKHDLNRVIIAGYRCLEINKYIRQHTKVLGAYSSLVRLANIGEQCANVHVEKRFSATRKAYRLIKASMEAARYSIPRKRGKKKLSRRVLIIGAGVSGMTCALSLAKGGGSVTLVEKEGELGGNARHIYYTLRTDDVQNMVKKMISEVEEHPEIEIYKNSTLASLEGSWGSYRSVINTREGEKEIIHGAVVFASGGHELKPEGFLFGRDKRVITQREMERLLYLKDNAMLSLTGAAMVQCVSCRNESHPYCSRVCCIHAVKNALKLKELNPGAAVYIFYRDIRTYGFYEESYRLAREKGVVFIRYEAEQPPEIKALDGFLRVTFEDRILGESTNLEVDALVLSNGIEPNRDKVLTEIANIELTPDGFFSEANPKSAPLDAVDRGKFFCGICHSPNLLENVISQGKAAAARASVLLWRGEGYFTDNQAFVMERKCIGCGICVSVCPFKARYIDAVKNTAKVKDDICKGCGICVASCKNGASGQYDFEKIEVIRELEQILI